MAVRVAEFDVGRFRRIIAKRQNYRDCLIFKILRSGFGPGLKTSSPAWFSRGRVPGGWRSPACSAADPCPSRRGLPLTGPCLCRDSHRRWALALDMVLSVRYDSACNVGKSLVFAYGHGWSQVGSQLEGILTLRTRTVSWDVCTWWSVGSR
jgi:hypothetical protein